jgi:hypothetical protein
MALSANIVKLSQSIILFVIFNLVNHRFLIVFYVSPRPYPKILWINPSHSKQKYVRRRWWEESLVGLFVTSWASGKMFCRGTFTYDLRGGSGVRTKAVSYLPPGLGSPPPGYLGPPPPTWEPTRGGKEGGSFLPPFLLFSVFFL